MNTDVRFNSSDIAGYGFVPHVAFFCQNQLASGSQDSVGHLSFGISSSGNESAIGIMSEDGGVSDNASAHSDIRGIVVPNSDNNFPTSRGDYTFNDTSINCSRSGYTSEAIMVLSHPLSHKLVSFQSPVATGVQTINLIDFQPEFIMLMTAGQGTFGESNSNTDVKVSFGFTDKVNQVCIGIESNQGQVTGDTSRVTSNQNILWIPFDKQGTLHKASFVSVHPSGFTLNWTNILGQVLVTALCVSGLQAQVGLETQSSGVKDTDLGISPKCILGLSVGHSNINAVQSGLSLSIGFGNASSGICCNYTDQDNTSPINTNKSLNTNNFMELRDHDGTLNAEGTLSILPSGFRINWSADSVERYFAYAAFGGDNVLVSRETLPLFIDDLLSAKLLSLTNRR